MVLPEEEPDDPLRGRLPRSLQVVAACVRHVGVGPLGDIDRVVRKGWSGRLRLWLLRRTASVCIAISREIADELCSVGIEPLVRYDFLDEDTALPDTSRNRVTIGVNYYFNKYARMMANWEIIHADGTLRTHLDEAK